MEEIRLTFREVMIYVVTANVILGVLFGTVSLLLGFKRNRIGIGAVGLVASIVGGMAAGLFLSYPLTMIFVWILLREPKTVDIPAETSAVS